MKCYDCTQEGRDDTLGIGVCARCGLFTCQDHAQIVRESVQQHSGLARTTSRLLARRVVCTTCRAAETVG
ncbi:DUF2180 family protein [Streptomyces sp. GESEQ-35]|uniref:DUF2180 family protein n=1 Tax=Streptomyces sp. GESEQ-35 TaxID=2812657 RepID=UPI001B32522C|nr:DUF2180 family protein [Streptomyces sp. GESEQ-35]